MASSTGERVWELFDRAKSAGSLSAVVFQGLGAILFAFGAALSSGIVTIADVIIVPLSTLINQSGRLLESIIGGAAQIIDIGALTSALSIAPGARFDVGPVTFVLAIGVVLLAMYLIVNYLSLPETGNFSIAIPFDIPTPGFLGPEEDNEGE